MRRADSAALLRRTLFEETEDMIDTSALGGLSALQGPAMSALRGKIGWICQIVRFMALAYAAWVLYLVLAHWTSAEEISATYGRMLRVDVSGMAGWQLAASFGVNFALWLLVAAACACAWRLFTSYLEGNIFTVEAALWLRRVAFLGLVAQGLGVATRPLLSALVTAHLAPDQQRILSIFLRPDDLLTLLFLASLLALAYIHKSAAEIAGEHAAFV